MPIPMQRQLVRFDTKDFTELVDGFSALVGSIDGPLGEAIMGTYEADAEKLRGVMARTPGWEQGTAQVSVNAGEVEIVAMDTGLEFGDEDTPPQPVIRMTLQENDQERDARLSAALMEALGA